MKTIRTKIGMDLALLFLPLYATLLAGCNSAPGNMAEVGQKHIQDPERNDS